MACHKNRQIAPEYKSLVTAIARIQPKIQSAYEYYYCHDVLIIALNGIFVCEWIFDGYQKYLEIRF